MKLINRTDNGQLSYCKCCDVYQLEFGNILFSFPKKDFSQLKQYVSEIDGTILTQKNAHLSSKRKIFLQFPVKNILFCLHAEELEELKELLFLKKKTELGNCCRQLTDSKISFN